MPYLYPNPVSNPIDAEGKAGRDKAPVTATQAGAQLSIPLGSTEDRLGALIIAPALDHNQVPDTLRLRAQMDELSFPNQELRRRQV